jgi:hypothetical protein
MMTMDRTEGLRQATVEARRARDLMWGLVLQELEFRNPAAARASRVAAHAMRVRPLVGYSTGAAALAWPHLDYQARADWLWICQTMHHVWIRGALETTYAI